MSSLAERLAAARRQAEQSSDPRRPGRCRPRPQRRRPDGCRRSRSHAAPPTHGSAAGSANGAGRRTPPAPPRAVRTRAATGPPAPPAVSGQAAEPSYPSTRWQHRDERHRGAQGRTCTPSCSSSSAPSCTTPTSTRPTSRAGSARCSATCSRAQDRPLSNADRTRITQEITDDILGYGPIEPFLRDPDVTEIMVNGSDRSTWRRSGRLTPVKAQFSDEAHLRRTIDKIVSRIGRRVDESSPMVDARLPDGSRVNAVIPPLAVDGSALTIRKFAADPLTVDDLIDFGTLSREDRRLPRRLRPRPAQHHRLRAAPAPARRPRSTCCRRSSPTTSASSPSRTPPSSSSSRTTSSGWSRARPTSRARAR